MPLMQRVYSVLLVSAAQNLNTAMHALLSGSRYDRVDTVSDVSAAKRACAEGAYDFVIVNSPLPDDTGVRFSIDLSGGETVVLLLVRAELYNEVTDKVCEHGVFTLSRPASRQIAETALESLAASLGFIPWDMQSANAPWNTSPAPVVSTASTWKAGRVNIPSSSMPTRPFSPMVKITHLGPRAFRSFRASSMEIPREPYLLL